MNEKLLFECFIDILGHNVGVKIYKDEDIYSFTLSDYFQDESQMDVYRPGSGSFAGSLDGLFFKINAYKNQIRKIVKIEHNDLF
ncbi:hypothetical protein [Culturomica sp.]|uniref:hypothetical protein n=1 Tax=Culturomica sp. TaxID=1926652 RepID=UPI000E994B70|nr:hypothetical protein [Culturomica sp.]HBO27779.1 hypothetical protein [Culturomica sp.]